MWIRIAMKATWNCEVVVLLQLRFIKYHDWAELDEKKPVNMNIVKFLFVCLINFLLK